MASTTMAPPTRPSTRPRNRGRVRAVLLPVLGLVILIAAWWLSVVTFHVKDIFVPSPGEIASAFAKQPMDILLGVWTTVEEMLGGFGLAIVVGLVIAFVISSSATLNQMFYPLIVAANAIPKVALAPLLVFSLGLGLSSKVAVAFLVSFFPIVVASYAGFVSTPADFTELARSLSASRLQAFAKVRFPAALPQIFVGLKVAAPLAAVGAVVGEFAGSMRGLGNELFSYSGQGRTPEAFAVVILLSVISLALFYLVVLIERVVLPWAPRTMA